jgi:hypothetical protein
MTTKEKYTLGDNDRDHLGKYRTRPDYGESWIVVDPTADRDDELWRAVQLTRGRDGPQGGDTTQQRAYKSRPDLLPSEAVLAAGRVLAFGLEKHPDELWKTLSVEDHVAASLRHIYQHQNGPDPETGESHLAHALCRLAFAIARGAE